jgi:hypothetical protein
MTFISSMTVLVAAAAALLVGGGGWYAVSPSGDHVSGQESGAGGYG